MTFHESFHHESTLKARNQELAHNRECGIPKWSITLKGCTTFPIRGKWTHRLNLFHVCPKCLMDSRDVQEYWFLATPHPKSLWIHKITQSNTAYRPHNDMYQVWKVFKTHCNMYTILNQPMWVMSSQTPSHQAFDHIDSLVHILDISPPSCSLEHVIYRLSGNTRCIGLSSMRCWTIHRMGLGDLALHSSRGLLVRKVKPSKSKFLGLNKDVTTQRGSNGPSMSLGGLFA